MKLAVFCLLAIISVVYAEETYTDKFDNIDIDQVIRNERLLKRYVDCMLDKPDVRCPPEAIELRKHIDEALENDCAKCTNKQREITEKVINHLVRNKKDWWDLLKVKYDPEGKFSKKYEEAAKNENIKCTKLSFLFLEIVIENSKQILAESANLTVRYLIPSLPSVTKSASQALVVEIQYTPFLAFPVEERADYASQPLRVSGGEQQHPNSQIERIDLEDHVIRASKKSRSISINVVTLIISRINFTVCPVRCTRSTWPGRKPYGSTNFNLSIFFRGSRVRLPRAFRLASIFRKSNASILSGTMRYLVVVFITVCVLSSSSVFAEEMYTTKFDNVDVDAILSNDRLLNGYVGCLLDKNPCTPDASELKKNLPDALEHDCAGCSEAQKNMADKISHHLIDNKPDDWKLLEDKYDPTGAYRRRYLENKSGDGGRLD
ncbi:PEB3 protein, partial [Acromyrmex insinuator]